MESNNTMERSSNMIDCLRQSLVNDPRKIVIQRVEVHGGTINTKDKENLTDEHMGVW